jgi:hypothetical protein
MKFSDRDLELIEAWFSGHAEGQALEQRLRDEPAFGEAVQQLLAVEAALSVARQERLRQNLRRRQRVLVRRRAWRRYALAAAAVLAVAVAVFLLPLRGSREESTAPAAAPVATILPDLSRKYWEHLAAPNHMAEPDPHNARMAIKRYIARQYAEAIPLLEAEYRRTGDVQTRFYLGVAAVGAGRGALAVEHLEPCRDREELRADDVAWYLVLAYLLENDRLRAVTLLDEIIADPGNAYYARAVALRAELGKSAAPGK